MIDPNYPWPFSSEYTYFQFLTIIDLKRKTEGEKDRKRERQKERRREREKERKREREKERKREREKERKWEREKERKREREKESWKYWKNPTCYETSWWKRQQQHFFIQK